MSKRYLILIVFGLTVFAYPVFAIETLHNAGLISKNIWYSKDPFYAGDKIRIYSVIYNGSAKDLRGRVNFYDNRYLLCTSEFASLMGRVSEVWCDWTPTAGNHAVSVAITNPKASAPGENEESVMLENSEFADEAKVINNILLTPVTQSVSEQSARKTVNTESGIVSKIAGYVSQVLGGEKSDIVGSDYESQSQEVATSGNSVAGPYSSVLKSSKSAVLNSLNNKHGVSTSLPGNITSNTNPLSYIAAVSDQLAIFAARVPFLGDIKSRILTTLQSFKDSNNGPIGYVMSFVYSLAKFILDSPIILSFIALYIVWRFVKRLRPSRTYTRR